MRRHRRAAGIVVAAGALASATLPKVDRSPNAFDWVHGALCVLVAAVLLVAVSVPLAWRVQAAAFAIGAWVLMTDAAESIFENEQRAWSIVRTVLFLLALALVALVAMLEPEPDAEVAP